MDSEVEREGMLEEFEYELQLLFYVVFILNSEQFCVYELCLIFLKCIYLQRSEIGYRNRMFRIFQVERFFVVFKIFQLGFLLFLQFLLLFFIYRIVLYVVFISFFLCVGILISMGMI